MGSCIICGAKVDGYVCESHQEDVYFEFTGTDPDELTPGRFYRGTVDGFADFGVFINIGEEVTGLLHTSELDRRLESLDWQPGEAVFVQVKNVRENGNVDLGWSIRQHESSFRGHLIDTPEGDVLSENAAERAPAEDEAVPQPQAVEREGEAGLETEKREGEAKAETATGAEAEPREPDEAEFGRSEIGSLEGEVGSPVRIEGRVIEARQTSGPTIFEVRDDTGLVDCAAFEAAGVRAYPRVETGDVVRIAGEVEERRGEVQIETESLSVLEGEEREVVETRLEEALSERARPGEVDLLADHPAVEAVRGGIADAAAAIRRAVFESRPVVVRHSATADGYVAGAAVERAVLGLIRDEHEEADAEYHYFDRRPLEDRIYGMDDAMRDTTTLLEAEERHGENPPLFAFVNAGSTEESRDGIALLSTYGGDAVVVDGDYPDESMADAVSAFVSPHLDGDGEGVSTTALAANVAAHVNGEVRADLRHLPATSYWRDLPEPYEHLAATAGYDAEATAALREAVALQAFYQAYEAKRELIADLLFEKRELAEHASEQFRERIEEEIRTARPHVEERTVDGRTLGVLDVDAFTHEYEFPPIEVLLAELAGRVEADAIIGADEDRFLVWSETGIDMREVGERAAEAVPDGGVETRGGRDGRLVFLSGEREAVLEAAIPAVADGL